MINEKDLQTYINEVWNIESKSEHKNLEKRLKRNVMRAISDFNMIEEWETILLWVSGWKDSMLLWYILNEIRKSSKVKFNIRWVYIFKEFLINS